MKSICDVKISVMLGCTYRENLLSKLNIVERKQWTALTTKLKFHFKSVINLNYANDKVKYMFLLPALINFHPKIANKNCRSSGFNKFFKWVVIVLFYKWHSSGKKVSLFVL